MAKDCRDTWNLLVRAVHDDGANPAIEMPKIIGVLFVTGLADHSQTACKQQLFLPTLALPFKKIPIAICL
jgi:hypothetical protein